LSSIKYNVYDTGQKRVYGTANPNPLRTDAALAIILEGVSERWQMNVLQFRGCPASVAVKVDGYGVLEGLVLAGAEFESAAEAETFKTPDFIVHEVSSDARFTGGLLVHASRRDLETWLSDYGLRLSDERDSRG
jgi:hypothetical protein